MNSSSAFECWSPTGKLWKANFLWWGLKWTWLRWIEVISKCQATDHFESCKSIEEIPNFLGWSNCFLVEITYKNEILRTRDIFLRPRLHQMIKRGTLRMIRIHVIVMITAIIHNMKWQVKIRKGMSFYVFWWYHLLVSLTAV